MDVTQGLLTGFAGALTPNNLLACFLGVLWGTLVGVLPGIGPVGGLVLLLPITYQMDVTAGIIMMAGIYYGCMYGGSTTSILANIPGEVASVVTCLDGHQLAKNGRAGAALAVAAIASFVAGTFAVVGLSLTGPPLVMASLSFGPPEYFSLMFLGLCMVAYLSGRSLTKGLIAAFFGMALGTIGFDRVTGAFRYTFNNPYLQSGVDLVPVAMGLFGVGEVLSCVERNMKADVLQTNLFDFRRLLPSGKEWRIAVPAMVRGSILGFFVGILPGAAAIVSSFMAYALEKRLSKHPEKFGTGIIEGVAAPEAANNSAAGGAMIPLLALGVPYNVVTALMLNAMVVQGVQPSPFLMQKQPEFFWTVIASMYVGNAMLLVLNLPLVGIWAAVLRIPYLYLFPGILMMCFVGVYADNYTLLDLQLMAGFGVLGYLMGKTEYPGAPVLLGMVLGPLAEKALAQSMILSSGSPAIFFMRPISGTIMVVSFLVLLIPIASWAIGKRSQQVLPRGQEE